MKKISYEVNRGRGGARKKRVKGNKVAELNITSLVDILTILLLFLIKNVSMEVQKYTIAPGIEPPLTVNTDDIIESGQTVVVIFGKEKIEVANSIVEGITYNELISKNKDLQAKRKGLFKFLEKQATKIASSKGNNIPLMLIQSDRSVPCRYVTEFIKFSAGSGFANIYFATLDTSKNEVLGR